MEISFSDGFSCSSEPTSASSSNHEMCFYSPAASPSRFKLDAQSGFLTETTILSTHEDESFTVDEFETGQGFNVSGLKIETNQKDENTFDHMQEQNQSIQKDDELFFDGEVLPLLRPLKLPPRLLGNGKGSKMRIQSSNALSSPRPPGCVIRLPFSSHSFKNYEFDPFMVALEKVKEENIGNPKGKYAIETKPHQAQVISELQRESLKKEPRSANMPSKPKGLMFQRQVKVGDEEPFELAMDRRKNDEIERGDFCTKKRKEEPIVKFLFGNADTGKGIVKHKLTASMVVPTFLRKLVKSLWN